MRASDEKGFDAVHGASTEKILDTKMDAILDTVGFHKGIICSEPWKTNKAGCFRHEPRRKGAVPSSWRRQHRRQPRRGMEKKK
jgi:hypothetical protein